MIQAILNAFKSRTSQNVFVGGVSMFAVATWFVNEFLLVQWPELPVVSQFPTIVIGVVGAILATAVSRAWSMLRTKEKRTRKEKKAARIGGRFPRMVLVAGAVGLLAATSGCALSRQKVTEIAPDGSSFAYKQLGLVSVGSKQESANGQMDYTGPDWQLILANEGLGQEAGTGAELANVFVQGITAGMGIRSSQSVAEKQIRAGTIEHGIDAASGLANTAIDAAAHGNCAVCGGTGQVTLEP